MELAELSGRIFETVGAGPCNAQSDTFLACGDWGAAAPFPGIGTGEEHEVAVIQIER
jgi:hypothetical protein